jgi:hypothetical protein
MHVMLATAALTHVLWLGPKGEPLPFTSEREAEEFLLRADLVASKELTGSHNRPRKVRLERGGIAANAIFRTVDKRSASARVSGVTIRDFRDSYVFECAAYELNRLLGFTNVPPCVVRELAGEIGSVQLWIEDATTAYQYGLDADGPAAADRWPDEFDTMAVFDALIDNFDRHLGNVLVDSQGRVWFIDHTRSFRLYTDAPLEKVPRCSPALFPALSRLARKDLDELKPYVGVRYLDAVWRRRGQLLERLSCSDTASGAP